MRPGNHETSNGVSEVELLVPRDQGGVSKWVVGRLWQATWPGHQGAKKGWTTEEEAAA